MYIFKYQTPVFIQNLYILVKCFGKNLIFSIKSTIFCFFSGPNVHFWYQTPVFIQNLYILVKFFVKNLIFSIKSTNILFFQDQMYILVKSFSKNLIFIVKSTYFLFSKTKCTFLSTKLQFLSKICTFWWNFLAKT